MSPTAFEQWLTAHGLPMTVTLVVIYLLFRYFLKQVDKNGTPCQKNFKTLEEKLDKVSNDIANNRLAISNLKGLLSGIFFRNSGGNND